MRSAALHFIIATEQFTGRLQQQCASSSIHHGGQLFFTLPGQTITARFVVRKIKRPRQCGTICNLQDQGVIIDAEPMNETRSTILCV
jgi:hypothetical protein